MTSNQSGNVPASSSSTTTVATVEWKTVLRVRPLLKKERDDPIALEALSCGTAVALHPPVVKETSVVTTGLNDMTSVVIATGEDVEFAFDRVLSTAANQEKMHAVIGQPIARLAMESLKQQQLQLPQPNHRSSKSSSSTRSHLILGMGLAYSGTTYTCIAGSGGNGSVVAGAAASMLSPVPGVAIGGGNNAINNNSSNNTAPAPCHVSSKRKYDTDGLVPRILDSLYSQSKHYQHHVSQASSSQSSSSQPKKNATLQFAVKMTLLQVNQNKTNPSDCHLYDLLQPVSKNGAAAATAATNGTTSTTTSAATSAASAVVEQLGTGINNLAASLMNSMNQASNGKRGSASNNNNHTHRRRDHNGATSKSSSAGSGNAHTYTALPNEAVRVQQDAVTSHCRVVNALHRTCSTPEEARATLQLALTHAKDWHHKKYASHVYIQLQPVWMVTTTTSSSNSNNNSRSHNSNNRSHAKIVQMGDTITILDMARWQGPHATKPRASSTARASRDLNRDNAHTAVMHCLKAVQYNQMNDTTSTSTSKKLRKVPFLQHPVTMLLQPLFAQSTILHVTLLMTASPSNRDYVEKKTLLTEVAQLATNGQAIAKMQAAATIAATAAKKATAQTNGAMEPEFSKRNNSSSTTTGKKKTDGMRSHHPSDAEDEASLDKNPRRSNKPSKHPVSAYDSSFMMVMPGVVGGGALLQTDDETVIHPTSAKEQHGTSSFSDDHTLLEEYDSGLLARQKSESMLLQKQQQQLPHGRPTHLVRKNSMAYSESTTDDNSRNNEASDSESDDDDRSNDVCAEKISPRPPPVAPGYQERLTSRQQAAAAPSSYAAMTSPQASAPPMEDDDTAAPMHHTTVQSLSRPPPPILTVDFPGVVMPTLPSTRSALTEVTALKPAAHHPRSPSVVVPIAIAEEATSDDAQQQQSKFSYMKTINKVVHASKKKGRKVMERMTVTTIGSSGSSSDTQWQQRIAELELQNAALVRENANLRQQNERLIKLSGKTDNGKESVLGDSPSGKSSSMDDTPKSTTSASASSSFNESSPSDEFNETPVTTTIENETTTWTTSDNFGAEKGAMGVYDRRTSVESCVESCAPDQLYDNPLFHHMAAMNNQTTTSRRKSKSSRVTHRSYEKRYNAHDGGYDSNDENSNILGPLDANSGSSKALFDDPLLQHMAMMNY